jgi:hypothetical protein
MILGAIAQFGERAGAQREGAAAVERRPTYFVTYGCIVTDGRRNASPWELHHEIAIFTNAAWATNRMFRTTDSISGGPEWRGSRL